MNTLPRGYSVYQEGLTFIVVAMTDFMLIFEDAEPQITYNGKLYKRGTIEIIPAALAGHACSMRRYDLVVVD